MTDEQSKGHGTVESTRVMYCRVKVVCDVLQTVSW